jgi:hypothetical protein
MPRLGIEIGCNCAQNDDDDLRKTDALSYIFSPGRSSPAQCRRGGCSSVVRRRRRPGHGSAAMIDLVELVALSLLPLKSRRRAARRRASRAHPATPHRDATA